MNLKGKITKGVTLGLLGFIVGWAGAVFIDFMFGANSTLSPKDLIMTLNKKEVQPNPHLICINAENFQAIKWIRIKCADSNEQDTVILK